MPTVPEVTRQHTHAPPPVGALPAESNVSASTALSVNTIVAGSAQNPKLLDRVRALIRTKHYSIKTERIYVFWIRQFVLLHGKRHPLDLGKIEVEAFLSHLANAKHVAASTQNQALAALLFLYKEVLEVKLPWLDGVVRAKRPKRLPVVLTKVEVDDLASAEIDVHHPQARAFHDAQAGAVEQTNKQPTVPSMRASRLSVRRERMAKGVRCRRFGNLGRHDLRKHSDRTGAARACGRFDHDDLHACAQSRRTRRAQSTGSVTAAAQSCSIERPHTCRSRATADGRVEP